MADLALIADDLTGAADAGVPFARAGFTTAIAFDRPRRERADVLALSTESRDLPVRLAERAVRTALGAVFGRDGAHRPAWIYKKMDSALRGHPVEELLVTMQVARVQRVIVAPALPSQGRTTVGGIVYDHGVPLAETDLGREHGRQNLVALFQRASRVPVRSIDLATVRAEPIMLRTALSTPGAWIVVADAETESDLEAIATVGISAGIRLFAGSAGLTGVLAQRLPIHQLERPPDAIVTGKPVLVVAGSRHEATRRQLEAAVAAGACLIRLEQRHIEEGADDSGEIQRALAAALGGQHPVIVTTIGLAPVLAGSPSVAATLAEAVALPDLGELIGGVVLTGGDVAAAVCGAMGVQTIWLRGEVQPAIPWASLGGGRLEGMPVVTKAGSFGGDDAIVAAIRHLGSIGTNS
jgi:uncharacterized protein YgbK (DUF1537 family)